MKKLAFLSVAFLVAISVLQLQAQEVKKEAVKKEIKATKNELKTEKSELKNEKKALRKLEGSEVNVISKNSFYLNFGEVPNVKWKRSDYFDEAMFNKDGKEMTAYFDFPGNLVGTTSLSTFAEVPVSGQKEIKKNYKDYTIGKVLFCDDHEASDTDMFIYGAQFADRDNYFVEMAKGNNKIVLQVNPEGIVYFFKQL